MLYTTSIVLCWCRLMKYGWHMKLTPNLFGKPVSHNWTGRKVTGTSLQSFDSLQVDVSPAQSLLSSPGPAGRWRWRNQNRLCCSAWTIKHWWWEQVQVEDLRSPVHHGSWRQTLVATTNRWPWMTHGPWRPRVTDESWLLWVPAPLLNVGSHQSISSWSMQLVPLWMELQTEHLSIISCLGPNTRGARRCFHQSCVKEILSSSDEVFPSHRWIVILCAINS